jgi:hypothetical protein
MTEEILARRLWLFPATNIVVANMIGAGIFTTSGLLMSGLNDPVLMLLLWIVGGIIALLGTFEQVLTYMGFALGIFPILTVLSVFRLRKRYPHAIRMEGFPFTQIIYATTGLLILGLSFLERPLESSIAMITVAIGVPVFYLFKKNRQMDSCITQL